MLLRSAAFLADEDTSIARQCAGLAQLIGPQARSEAVLASMCQEPGAALEHAAAHIHLQALGYGDEGVDLLMQDLLADEGLPSPGLLIKPELEYHWLRQIATGATAERDGARLIAGACWARPLDALGAAVHDYYAFTHVVLHASDMGRRAVQTPRPVSAIEADAEAGLAASLDAGNFDLAAELLWTWPMLDRPWSATAAFAFFTLAAEQDAHGFLPGPGYRSADARNLGEAQRGAYRLQSSYHAGIVFGFLCAAALRPGRAPPARLATGSPSERVPQLMRQLTERSEAASWRSAMNELDVGQQALLADFVLAVILRRAAAASDLCALREGLQAAAELELADGPSPRQALALLRRAMLMARISSPSQPSSA